MKFPPRCAAGWEYSTQCFAFSSVCLTEDSPLRPWLFQIKRIGDAFGVLLGVDVHFCNRQGALPQNGGDFADRHIAHRPFGGCCMAQGMYPYPNHPRLSGEVNQARGSLRAGARGERAVYRPQKPFVAVSPWCAENSDAIWKASAGSIARTAIPSSAGNTTRSHICHI